MADTPLAAFAGASTGIGSHPGTDPREAAATVVGEVPIPYLPELPARGFGADMIGRTAGLLVGLGLDTSTTGYRVGVRPGAAARLIDDYWQRDLDAFEEAYEVAGLRGGGLIKTQAVGPLTLAANLELANGHRTLRDHGAVSDVVDSLAEGLTEHISELRRRTGAEVVVQFDEPSMAAVVRGTVPPLSRLDPIAPVPAPEAAALMARCIEALGVPVLVHLCGPIVWDVVSRVPIAGAFVDVSRLAVADYEGFAALVESKPAIGLGLIPAVAGQVTDLSAEKFADRAAALYREIGLPRSSLARATVTPTCGFAGAESSWVPRAFAVAAATAAVLSRD